jgi:hypothetical protein
MNRKAVGACGLCAVVSATERVLAAYDELCAG